MSTGSTRDRKKYKIEIKLEIGSLKTYMLETTMITMINWW